MTKGADRDRLGFLAFVYWFTPVGMDVHKDSIPVGILPPDMAVPEVERIFPADAVIRRLFKALSDRGTGWPACSPRWESSARWSHSRSSYAFDLNLVEQV